MIIIIINQNNTGGQPAVAAHIAYTTTRTPTGNLLGCWLRWTGLQISAHSVFSCSLGVSDKNTDRLKTHCVVLVSLRLLVVLLLILNQLNQIPIIIVSCFIHRRNVWNMIKYCNVLKYCNYTQHILTDRLNSTCLNWPL